MKDFSKFAQPPTMDPIFPTEIIENVIDHFFDDVYTLRSFSLTCRDLLHRSRYHIFGEIRLLGQGQLNSFLDLLNATPSIRSLVRSVTISLSGGVQPLLEVIPASLLTLPNLKQWNFVDGSANGQSRWVAFHTSTLLNCRYLGAGVRILSVDNVSFTSRLALFQLLQSFSGLRRLNCNRIAVRPRVPDRTAHQANSDLPRTLQLTGLVVSMPVIRLF